MLSNRARRQPNTRVSGGCTVFADPWSSPPSETPCREAALLHAERTPPDGVLRSPTSHTDRPGSESATAPAPA